MTNSKKTKDLSATNIQNILDQYANRQDVEFRSRVVANNYIGEQGYNLSVSTLSPA